MPIVIISPSQMVHGIHVIYLYIHMICTLCDAFSSTEATSEIVLAFLDTCGLLSGSISDRWALQNMFAQPRNITWMTQSKCSCILCYVSIICRKCPKNCSSQSVDVILNQHAQEVQGLSWLTVLHGSFKLLVGWMTIDGFVLGLSDLVHTNVFAYTIVWVLIMHTDIYYIAHVVDIDMFSCFC